MQDPRSLNVLWIIEYLYEREEGIRQTNELSGLTRYVYTE